MPPMDTARAIRLIRQYTAVTDPALVERIAARMVATGECAWHATAQVTGATCWCLDCRDLMDPRRLSQPAVGWLTR